MTFQPIAFHLMAIDFLRPYCHNCCRTTQVETIRFCLLYLLRTGRLMSKLAKMYLILQRHLIPEPMALKFLMYHRSFAMLK